MFSKKPIVTYDPVKICGGGFICLCFLVLFQCVEDVGELKPQSRAGV